MEAACERLHVCTHIPTFALLSCQAAVLAVHFICLYYAIVTCSGWEISKVSKSFSHQTSRVRPQHCIPGHCEHVHRRLVFASPPQPHIEAFHKPNSGSSSCFLDRKMELTQTCDSLRSLNL